MCFKKSQNFVSPLVVEKTIVNGLFQVLNSCNILGLSFADNDGSLVDNILIQILSIYQQNLLIYTIILNSHMVFQYGP